jgi:5'-nucleotidase
MKRILLTGDDGYKSVGTRILVSVLKPYFDLTIVGTKVQQSGVGGFINVTKKIPWGETRVDGVPAVWLAGTPADGMEFAREYFKKPFDLVISGVNMGTNLGTTVISSGTYASAYRALALGVAGRAVVVSWAVPFHKLYENHSGAEAILHLKEYPGQVISDFIRLGLRQRFWGASLVNMNLPPTPTRRVRFTRFRTNVYRYWPPIVIRKKRRVFYYGSGLPHPKVRSLTIDIDAVTSGDISVTLATFDMTDEKAYSKMKGKLINL